MAKAKTIVNNLLETSDPDNPERYLDWLGQKVETGPLENIRFGAHIHLSDEDIIRLNAREAGIDVDSRAFWDEVERCMAIMESHCLQLLREAGLHVNDEGHDETDARVASVWIDTPEEDRKLALLKAVIAWAEGDWPSTTSGTMAYAFGADTTQRIYAMTEDAARFIDVTIEFTGTDALVEWSRLNLNEAVKGDPDDPEVFLKSYVPRMMGRLLIEFNVIKPHFPDAPANWYRERVDGMDLFHHNRASEMKEVMRQMKAYNRERGERAGIDQVTYRYKVPNPQGSSIVRGWLDKLGCPVPVIQWACETNPPIWFWVSVKEFNAYMQMVYTPTCLAGIKVKLDPVVEGIDDPDDPEAFVKNYREYYYMLWFGQDKFGNGALGGVYSSLDAAVAAAKERKLLKRAHHVWVTVDALPDKTDDDVIVGSESVGIVYDILQDYKTSEPRQESLDEPEQYLKGNVYTLDELREKLHTYGLSFPSNGISPWGRWVVIDGFTYWAVYSKDPEKWLPQSYFREQLEKFCMDMGFTVYHIQLFGEYPEGITFKLAVPKMQIDPEAYAPQERRLNDPDFDNQRQAHDTIQRDWLPEGESADLDDPNTFIQNMETDWRKILRQHGFKPQPHSDHLSYVLTYPDRVWGANWPVNVYAHHGWNPHPEFEYDHLDPNNPDIDAEDAAYDEWRRTHDEFAAIRERDIAFPDLIALQFGREGWRRIEVPTQRLDAFLTRFTAGAKKVVGTETVASVHQGRGLTEMIWEVAKNTARELKVPVKESLDVPDPMTYVTDTFNVPELLKRMGYQRSTLLHEPDWEEIPFEWHKVFNRMPTELDLMVEVKRRGLGGEENEGDVVYDITLYQYPVNDNPNKQWMPLVYRYGRTNLQLERVLKKLEERIKANNLRGIRDEVQESVPIPPEDEPENVLPSAEKSLVTAELKRLNFGPKPEYNKEWIYGEEMPRFWYNTYKGADGSNRALYIYFIGGQKPEVQTRNYNADAKAWFQRGKEPPPTAPAQSQAHLAAIIRDLDNAMQKSAADSLPVEQEFEAIERVIQHHRQWWEDTLDYLIHTQGGVLPGRVGAGRPA